MSGFLNKNDFSPTQESFVYILDSCECLAKPTTPPSPLPLLSLPPSLPLMHSVESWDRAGTEHYIGNICASRCYNDRLRKVVELSFLKLSGNIQSYLNVMFLRNRIPLLPKITMGF